MQLSSEITLGMLAKGIGKFLIEASIAVTLGWGVYCLIVFSQCG